MDGTQGDQGINISLGEIVDQCNDAPGYLVFVGVLVEDPETKERTIDFHYKRHKFTFEDTAKGIKQLRKKFREDIEGA